MFLAIVIAVVLEMAIILFWALKHRRTPALFFGLSNTREERPILYWTQIVCYGAVTALFVGFLGALALAAISH